MMDATTVCALQHSSHQSHGVPEHMKWGQDDRGTEFPAVFHCDSFKLQLGPRAGQMQLFRNSSLPDLPAQDPCLVRGPMDLPRSPMASDAYVSQYSSTDIYWFQVI